MKKYRVKNGETLGTIARKYALPSWKYLYELNKEAIGDNPDLLEPGTELNIPLWDSTSGDEKIRAKGGLPSLYVGGQGYAYPWVPYSVTLVNRRGEVLTEKRSDGEVSEEFEREKVYVISDGADGRELVRGTIKRADGIEVLVPDAGRQVLTVEEVEYRPGSRRSLADSRENTVSPDPVFDRVERRYLDYRRERFWGGVSAAASPAHRRPRIPHAVIDAHMHIMSGFCTPLRAKLATVLGRETSGKLGRALGLVPGAIGGVGRLAIVASKPTRAIAADTLRRARHIRLYTGRVRLLPMVALPMDMDFAHIDGYRYQEAYKRVELSIEDQYALLVYRAFLTVLWGMGYQCRYFRLACTVVRSLLTSDIRTNDNKPYEWWGAIVQDLNSPNGKLDKKKNGWLLEVCNKAVATVEKLVTVRITDGTGSSLLDRVVKQTGVDLSVAEGAGDSLKVGLAPFLASRRPDRPHGGYTDCMYSYRTPRSWNDPDPTEHLLPLTLSSQYETWWEQVEAHTACAARYPWQILPMYHYDPRRYHDDPARPFYWLVHTLCDTSATPAGGAGAMTERLKSAFSGLTIAGVSYTPVEREGRGPFIGFKMYPPLGYRPCDFTRLPHLKHFYRACEMLEVPVLAHCNPSGFTMRERGLFLDYDKAMQTAENTTTDPFISSQRLGQNESNMVRAGRTFDDYEQRMGYAAGRRTSARRGRERYFSDEYVSPEGWATVLKNTPNLRLCLAHFGSNEMPSGRRATRALKAALYREEARFLEEEIRVLEDPAIGQLTDDQTKRLRMLREGVQRYRDTARTIERSLARKARRKRRAGPGDIPPPPNSGWEFLITDDWIERSRTNVGLSDEAVALWRRFPLWNRQIIALICTHPHVYTDISYFFLADRQFDRARMRLSAQHQARFRTFYRSFRHALGLCAKLRRRVLFGTDWYMTLNDVYGLWEYYDNVEDVLENLAADLEDRLGQTARGEPHLTTLLTVLNPLRYYRLDQLRTTYSMVLEKYFGARADKLKKEDEKIAKLCALACELDPDNQHGRNYRPACEDCAYLRGSTCSLVEQMGFDQDGRYRYPEK